MVLFRRQTLQYEVCSVAVETGPLGGCKEHHRLKRLEKTERLTHSLLKVLLSFGSPPHALPKLLHKGHLFMVSNAVTAGESGNQCDSTKKNTKHWITHTSQA